MTRTTTALAVTLVFGAAAAVFAGQPPPESQAPRGPGGPPPGPPPLERALQLTAEQQQAFKALREEEHEAVRPLMEQMRPLHERLREALESGAPEATAVGQLVIELHGLEQQVKATHESFRERLVALLTPEQRQQLEALDRLMGPGGRPGPFGPAMGPHIGMPPPLDADPHRLPRRKP